MRDIDEMLDFFLYEKGENIKINNMDETSLITDAMDKLNYYNDKLIRCKSLIKTGDKIEYKGHKYLVISQVKMNNNSYQARIRKCSDSIAFNWEGNVKWFEAIEESKVFDISTGKYFELASGNIYVTMQNNFDTRNIALNQRFYVTNQPFKVTGIDKSKEGLIKFNCILDSINTSYDDVENNIVDRWKYETSHTYLLTIDNGEDGNVLLNNTMQLNVSVTDNGAKVENPAIIFSSNKNDIVSVDNTGKVMGIELGQAIVTANLTYHDTISDSINITVAETISHSYTVDITGKNYIYLNRTQSYVAHIFDNGTEIFDKSVVWSIRNQDGTTVLSYATITESTGNSVTIKAGGSSCVRKYVVLKATLDEDENIYKEFVVQIKSII
ncbi:MAG: hypothetical protein VB095_06285 [Anaerovorax sp.]|nr:hypothetical protein [Anaerovorax sp.]